MEMGSKIAELKPKLHEKEMRETLSLRETVARLRDDCSAVRERALKDEETIMNLLEKLERKEKDFAEKVVELKTEIRDLEDGKKRAVREVDEWKKKCEELEAQLSKLAYEMSVEFENKFAGLLERNRFLEDQALRLVEENSRLKGKGKVYGELETCILKLVEEKFHLAKKEKGVVGVENGDGKGQSFERSSGKNACEIDDELSKRTKKCSGEDLVSSSEQSRKRVFEVLDSESEEDRVQISQLGKKRPKESESSSNHSYHCITPSGECSGSLQTNNDFTRTVEKETFNGTADMQQSNTQEVANGESHACWKRNHDSSGKCNSQTSERAYFGRIPSFEQVRQAKMRAESLQRNLSPCNPSFVKSMSRSHVVVGFWLHLPSKFCQKNLPAHESKMILEDETGLEHEVKYISQRSAFSGGWRGFALNHKLELGDALIFELTKPTRFKVHRERSCGTSEI